MKDDTFVKLKKHVVSVTPNINYSSFTYATVSNKVVISFEVELSLADILSKMDDILRGIQSFEDFSNVDYGVFLDAHNSGGFTLVTCLLEIETLIAINPDVHRIETFADEFNKPSRLK